MPARAVPCRDAPLDAVVEVPGSKSIANRALVCAALAEGESTITGLPDGDDTAAMIDCLEVLGVGVGDEQPGRVRRILGTGGLWRPGPATLPTRLAGTTSRFVTALAALGPGPYVVDGLPPLRSRPMRPLHDALRALGVSLTPGEEWGHLPVEVRGRIGAATAPLPLPGDTSSQYLTALMMIAPLLDGGLTVELTSPLVSRPYVILTAWVMSSFGAGGVVVGEQRIVVPAGRYSAIAFTVEPDASSASYPLAAAAVAGGRVTVPGLTSASLQGDTIFAELLGSMGCDVERRADGITVERHGELRGIDVDMADASDLVPTLAVVAAGASSPTTIRGVGFIRGKESDRIGDLCAELRRAGIAATPLDDGLRVDPAGDAGPVEVTLDTHHDHRLAMAFGILGLGRRGVSVADPDVVTKSWPQFWSMIDGLR